MYHSRLMGHCISTICTEPLLTYGKQALEDCRQRKPSFALEQVALDIIISTGIVSNFETHEAQPDPKDDYYYNSTLAHCVYYGVSTIPAAEKHLHGEIVSFGVLCLLTYDGQIRERDKIMAFNADMRLPVTLEEMDLTTEDVDKIVKKASSVIEWQFVPGGASEEKFKNAILETDEAGKSYLAQH